jgi:hypothetical protein
MSIISTLLEKVGIGGGSGDSSEEVEAEASDPNNYFAPEDAVWYKDKVVVNGKHARTYAVDSWPPSPQQHMFSTLLMNADIDYDLAVHVDPYSDNRAISVLDDYQTKLEDKRTGEFSRFIPDKGSLQETERVAEVMKKYVNRGESMFDATFFLTIYADDQDELNDYHDLVMNDLVRASNVSVTRCPLRQKEAMQSCSPIAKNVLGEKNDELKQKMLGSGIARTFPFIQDTFMEENGVMFGVNEESMTPVIVDIFNRSNGYNMITSGQIGAGKTFSSSQILLSMDAAYRDFQQFIVDPLGDFDGVANCLDGEMFVINGTESINPMEIKETPPEAIEESGGQINPWSRKKEELKWFFTTFFQQMGGENTSLNNKELAMLDTAITQTYNKKGITEDIATHHKESPTIMDLIETLEDMVENTTNYTNTDVERERQQREEIAVSLLLSFDPFREGGEFHNLAQSTDIDITGERTVYLDLSQIDENSDDLGVMMKLLFMKIYQEAKNTDNKVALTIDEAHKVMRDSDVTSGLEEMFRHSRHFDLSINLISQTPEEFYSSETVQAISKQCTIRRFHRVQNIDEEVAKDILELNDQEINYIQNCEMGKGKKDFSQALLKIGDENDRSIPLRIYGTRDEQIVIDHDRSEDVEEFGDPQSQSLKQALDLKAETSVPRYVGAEDELTNKVAAQIAKRRENRDHQVDAILDDEGVEESQSDDESADVADRSPSVPNEPAEQPAEQMDSGVKDDFQSLRRQLGSPSNVDEKSPRSIEYVAKQYGIGSKDDSTETLRKKIKTKVFDVELDVEVNLTSGYGAQPSVSENGSDVDESTDNSSEEEPSPPNKDGSNHSSNGGQDEPSGESQSESSDTSDAVSGDEEQSLSIESLEDISDDQINQMYLQYVDNTDAETTEEKRNALREAVVE